MSNNNNNGQLNTRNYVAQYILDHHQTTLNAIVALVIFVPPLIATIIILSQHFDGSHLSTYCIGAAASLGASVLSNLYFIYDKRRRNSRCYHQCTSIKNYLSWFTTIWFICGWIWFAQASGVCDEPVDDADGCALFKLSEGLLIYSCIASVAVYILYCLMLPVIMLLAPILIHMIRMVQPANDPQRLATQQQLNSMPVVTYKTDLIADADHRDCSMCLNDFEEGDLLRRLPCSAAQPHYFHVKCIDPWLLIKPECPNCRHPFQLNQPQQQDNLQHNQPIQIAAVQPEFQSNMSLGHANFGAIQV